MNPTDIGQVLRPIIALQRVWWRAGRSRSSLIMPHE